jgi:signal peptidase I
MRCANTGSKFRLTGIWPTSSSARRRTYALLLFACVSGIYLLFSPWKLGFVSGDSMNPTFHSGQPILIDRWHYRGNAIQSGDVVLLHDAEGWLIKRIYRVPGQRIVLIVAADPAEELRYLPIEPASIESWRRMLARHPRLGRLEDTLVPDGKYFVLGDNAGNSVDSRSFGFIDREQVAGIVRTPFTG